MDTQKHPLVIFAVLAAAFWLLAGMTLLTESQTAPPPSNYTVDFVAEGVNRLTDEARAAIVSAVNRWPEDTNGSETFTLIGLTWGSDWAIATLTYADLEQDPAPALTLDEHEDTYIHPGNLIALLLVQTPDGWQAALDTEPAVQDLLGFVPQAELSQQARFAIFPPDTGLLRPSELDIQQQYNGYKLPWPGGFPWARTRTGLGWHGGTWSGRFPENNSLDFDIVNLANSDILAAADGIVTHICRVAGQQQAGVVIQTGGTTESLGYLHLQSGSIPAGVTIGASVRQGNILGRMVEGNVNETCGYSLGTHVHIFFPSRPFTMDGYTFSDTDTQGGVSLFSSQPVSGTLLDAPENENIVRNGTFSDGFNHWTAQLNADYTIQSDAYGAYVAWRGQTAPAGVITQMVNYAVPANSVLEMSLDLGNSSPVDKNLRVHLHRHNGSAVWDDMLVCDFVVPANTPLQHYVLRKAVTSPWENARIWIEGSPADTLPYILTDNVQVRRYTTLEVTGTECHAPVAQRAWDFRISAPEGWIIGNGLRNPRELTSGLWYTVGGDNPYVLSPTLRGVFAENYRYLLVEMSSLTDTCGRVYFQLAGQRTFPESQYVTFEINPNGASQRYYLDMAANPAWAGEVTRIRLDPACDTYNADDQNVLALVRIMLTDVDPNLVLLSPEGIVTESYGNPVYTWPNLPNKTRYELYLAPAADVSRTIAYVGVSVLEACDTERCSVDLTTISDAFWLANGDYVVYLRAQESSGFSDWAGGFNFTLNAQRPTPPTLQDVTGTRTTSRPTFSWSLSGDAVRASWFHLYTAPQENLGAPVMDTWVARRDACGGVEGTNCTYTPSTDFVNGTYQLYMQGWGPGGASDWTNGLRYVLDSPPPAPITNLSVSDTNTPRPLFQWNASDTATWYQIWVGTLNPLQTSVNQWVYSGSLGCDPVCALRPDVLLNNRAYVWYVQGWGAGGISTGGVQGWIEGPPFSINR
ncbi:MAG: hypothetical protein OHK0046_24640 [Anaerolineae bacterium]